MFCSECGSTWISCLPSAHTYPLSDVLVKVFATMCVVKVCKFVALSLHTYACMQDVTFVMTLSASASSDNQHQI